MDPRRRTLGPLSQPSLNARASMGPSRVGKPVKRMSLHPSLGRTSARSSVGGSKRASSTGARRSSTHGIGKALQNGKSDVRAINNKGFQTACIRSLISYLSEHHFEHTISPKLLTTPSGRDVENIFLFLYQQFDPAFVFVKGFKEDGYNVLKQLLKYPANLSKTTLAAPGSPHTWPVVLASLAWLVDLLNYLDAAAAVRKQHEAVDPDVGERMFFDFLSISYAAYMGGQDDFPELEQELEDQFEAKNRVIQEHTEQIKRELEASTQRMQDLKTKQSPLVQLEQSKTDFLSDIEKFANAIRTLTDHKKIMEQKFQDNTREAGARVAELRAITQERDELQRQVDNQEISAEDVQKMNLEKNQLEQDLAGVQGQVEESKRDVWDREVQLGKKMSRVEDLASQYTKLAGTLGLLSSDAEREYGISFKVTIDAKSQDICTTDMETLMPIFTTLKNTMTQHTLAAQDSLISSQERVDRTEETLQQKQDLLAQVESELSSLQSACQDEKDATNATLAQIAEARVKLESELTTLKSTSTQSLEAMGNKLTAMYAEYDAKQRECEEEKEKFNETILTTLDLLTTHKAHIQETLAGMQASATSLHADVCSQ